MSSCLAPIPFNELERWQVETPWLAGEVTVSGIDSKSQYDVKVDLGEKNNGVARFRVTVQNHSDREFSYRPKSVWAEIVPVLPGGEEKPRYTFYDLCFENGCEVPTLEFRASGWPSEATKAKVLLWFKFQPTSPDEDLTLADDRWKKVGDWKVFELRGKGEPAERTILLKSKLVEKDVNPSCSVVVEQSVPSDMKLHTYTIEMKRPKNSADPGPDEVHCRSLPSPVPGRNGKVIHTFVFRIKPSDISNYRICVTSQKSILSNACAPPRELEVHVD